VQGDDLFSVEPAIDWTTLRRTTLGLALAALSAALFTLDRA